MAALLDRQRQRARHDEHSDHQGHPGKCRAERHQLAARRADVDVLDVRTCRTGVGVHLHSGQVITNPGGERLDVHPVLCDQTDRRHRAGMRPELLHPNVVQEHRRRAATGFGLGCAGHTDNGVRVGDSAVTQRHLLAQVSCTRHHHLVRPGRWVAGCDAVRRENRRRPSVRIERAPAVVGEGSADVADRRPDAG